MPWYYLLVNSKQRKVLVAIFEEPTRADIRWADIEALFKACEATVKEGAGSRVKIALKEANLVAVFHRPHPEPTTDRATVRRVRSLLREGGIKP